MTNPLTPAELDELERLVKADALHRLIGMAKDSIELRKQVVAHQQQLRLIERVIGPWPLYITGTA